ncbi:STAS domain-containing protein [Aquidulcibacter sp.]|uniref:STAS domain-containing protein n=1 Tax=Aquidulcibacter sp. TaxID=2052990 RepID=UPI0025BF2C7C|nr:STAS domain-containing protein [Aquidulcibacter sp.]MCA3695029.1 STAS domain-containing protein [Aquidulcibacter sp.]
MNSFMLPASLDTRAAPALHEALMGFDGQPLTLDGSQVESLGGQCLQILLAAHEVWAKHETPFAIENPSDALAAQWSAFGAPLHQLSPQGDPQ